MKIIVSDSNGELCSFDERLINEILLADSSEGQAEEAAQVLDTLRSFSADKESIVLDLNKILADKELCAAKAKAMPVLLSALGRMNCVDKLSADIKSILVHYTNVWNAAVSIKLRNMITLKNLADACTDAIGVILFGMCSPDEAAKRMIIPLLPQRKMVFSNTKDLEFLYNVVNAVEAVADKCADNNNLAALRAFEDNMREQTEKYRRLCLHKETDGENT